MLPLLSYSIEAFYCSLFQFRVQFGKSNYYTFRALNYNSMFQWSALLSHNEGHPPCHPHRSVPWAGELHRWPHGNPSGGATTGESCWHQMFENLLMTASIVDAQGTVLNHPLFLCPRPFQGSLDVVAFIWPLFIATHRCIQIFKH